MNFINSTASVIGSSHYNLFYNNQDAYNFYRSKNCIIGVVADGCGSGANSEVGSKLGVDFVVNFCKKHFENQPFNLELLKNSLVEYLKNIVKNQETNEELAFIEDYLFFTLFGFIIQPNQTCIFHSGDGLYILNDKEVIIDQDNRPNYIAKNLISGNVSIEAAYIETSNLKRLLIATDGLMHLREQLLRGHKLGGMTTITDFFDNEIFFDNVVALPKLLTDLSINQQILRDDTSMIMIKQ